MGFLGVSEPTHVNSSNVVSSINLWFKTSFLNETIATNEKTVCPMPGSWNISFPAEVCFAGNNHRTKWLNP